jgi:hypothetical protein
MPHQRHKLFRVRDIHDHSPVTYIELFFDLVFVFAITQLSHRLLAHLTPSGRTGNADIAARSLVGVDLHQLGDQLARSRTRACAADADHIDDSRVWCYLLPFPMLLAKAGLHLPGPIARCSSTARCIWHGRRAVCIGAGCAISCASLSGSCCRCRFGSTGRFAKPICALRFGRRR